MKLSHETPATKNNSDTMSILMAPRMIKQAQSYDLALLVELRP